MPLGAKNADLNKNVLRFRWNNVRDEDARTLCGNEFQTVGAETRKLREPNDKLNLGTVSRFAPDERSGRTGT